MTYWEDKVVVVTGGSAGLGLELAKALIAKRAIVALVARNEERLRSVCAELGANAHGFTADVTSQSQVDQARDGIVDQFGRVDALINCAGKSVRGAILETTPDDFQDLFELNFLSAVRCTLAFMPAIKRSQGHLVNIGSLAAKSVSKFLGAYPASKFPLAAYSQQLRLELETDAPGVHVLLVCPGPIARSDAGQRYENADVPEAARKPGGGVKLKGLDPAKLAADILQACERRKLELIVPRKAKLLFVLSQCSARLGDWLIKKMTS